MNLANSIFVLESNLLENKVNKACKSLKRFFRLAYYKKKLAKYILKIFYK